MKLLSIVVVLVGLAIVMVMTNPSRADVDAEIEVQLLDSIDQLDTSANQDPTIKLIFEACKLGRSACASLASSLISVKMDNKVLYSDISVSFGGGDPIQCYGALTKVICPDL
jgi:hypothetical protein